MALPFARAYVQKLKSFPGRTKLAFIPLVRRVPWIWLWVSLIKWFRAWRSWQGHMHPHEGSLTRDKPPTRFRKQMNQEEWFVDYSLGSEGQCVISRDEFQGPGKTVGNCVSPTRRRVANKRGYVFMSLWKDRNWGHYIFHSSIDYIGNHFCANALKIVCSCRNINLFTVYNFAYKLVRAYAQASQQAASFTPFRDKTDHEEWFVNCSLVNEDQCVMSCDEFQGHRCGGRAKEWEVMLLSAEVCCQ